MGRGACGAKALSSGAMSVRIVRLGSPRLPGEGTRIGTVRRPPCGVPKHRFALDDWHDVWVPARTSSGATGRCCASCSRSAGPGSSKRGARLAIRGLEQEVYVLAISLLVTATLIQAPPAATPVSQGLTLSGVESTTLHSKLTGQEYRVLVALPPTYGESGDRRYPVLYVPDHEDIFLGAKAAYGMLDLARSLGMGRPLEEFIIVGVPLQVAGATDWARRRTPDLTPTADPSFEEQFTKQLKAPVRSGAAAQFLRALKEELIPLIESRYRVTQDRGLAGYSLGGLFAAWVWLSGDATFSRFLIGSPSLWWNQESLLRLHPDRALKGRVFLSIGGAESKASMLAPFHSVSTAFSRCWPSTG
jgi:hypothetical protein